MDIEQGLLQQFLQLSTIVFSCAIFLIVLTVRRAVELAFPRVRAAQVWSEGVLPFLPIILGGVLAGCMKQYPYPELFTKCLSSRVFFGICAGGASSILYSRVKLLIAKVAPGNKLLNQLPPSE